MFGDLGGEDAQRAANQAHHPIRMAARATSLDLGQETKQLIAGLIHGPPSVGHDRQLFGHRREPVYAGTALARVLIGHPPGDSGGLRHPARSPG